MVGIQKCDGDLSAFRRVAGEDLPAVHLCGRGNEKVLFRNANVRVQNQEQRDHGGMNIVPGGAAHSYDSSPQEREYA